MFNLFSLGKMWSIVILVGAGGLLVSGIFGAGYYAGSGRVELRHEKENMLDYLAAVNKGFDIVDSFSGIAKDTAEGVVASRARATSTVRLGSDYAKAHPLPVYPDLPAYVIELRSCQIDALNTALGHSLPRERVGVTCPPPVPVEPEPGRHRDGG